MQNLNTAQANALQQKDNRIAELEKQLLAKRRPKTNTVCRTQVRHITRTLKKKGHEFDIHTNINTPHNQQHLQRVVTGVMGCKEAAKNEYTEEQAIEATKVYFTSLKQDNLRKQNGLKPKHRKGSRIGARKAKKFEQRLKGLLHQKCPLDKENREKARLIIKREYMSSDDDDVITNANGRPARRVRQLPWMSDLANHYKNVCHDTYVKHVLEKRDAKKYHHLIRDENCAVSERAVPKDIPTWAVKV